MVHIRLAGMGLVTMAAALVASMIVACGGDQGRASGEGAEPDSPDPLLPGQDDMTSDPGSADEDQGDGVLDFGVSDAPTNEVEVVCAAQSAASEFREVQLAFALDVSASMGQGNQRFNLKWQPIIAAARAFFSEPDSAAIAASLTFFPSQNNDTWCSDAAYDRPNVPLTPLPSPAFGAAITALNRTAGSNWRTATPTLAVFNGTVASLRAAAAPAPNLAQAVVLVTDGVPQNCTAQANDLDQVAAVVRGSGMQTFVVGVANPPGLDGGDNLDNLNVIAEAGGTERAFIVQTGDPLQTQADFKAVIDNIRGVSVSCNIEIPLPPVGTEFIPEQVNVTYGSAGEAGVRLTYDPSCAIADGWRYDDAAAPASIVLCNDVCGTIKQDTAATLNVEFGCERRGLPR